MSMISSQITRLLIVDDEPANIQSLARLFDDGYEVYFALNGASGLSTAIEKRPDLILLDVMMPVMDGYQVIAKLKSHPVTADIPVIFITALDDAESEVRGLEAGAVDYIPKPIRAAVAQARVRTHLELKRRGDQLKALADIDGLTGIPNRRNFDKSYILEWRRCQRNGSHLALIMIDVDLFKSYNDCYGHVAGDDCLKAIARALDKEAGRPGDLVARYGGEEFVCLLPSTDSEGAQTLAEAMRLAVRNLGLTHSSSSYGVATISLGVSCSVPQEDDDPADLLKKADEALYVAKSSGRDRVVAE